MAEPIPKVRLEKGRPFVPPERLGRAFVATAQARHALDAILGNHNLQQYGTFATDGDVFDRQVGQQLPDASRTEFVAEVPYSSSRTEPLEVLYVAQKPTSAS